jgi:hypothetical protein
MNSRASGWLFALINLSALGASLGACGADTSTTTSTNPIMEASCECRLATQLDNLALCVSPSTTFAPSHVYSTSLDATSNKPVCEPWRDPQPAPANPWTKLRISSACAGTGTLCVTVRAGSVNNLSPEDCTLATRCADIAYTTPGQNLELAPYAGWTAESSACAERQQQLGAYLEFSVKSDTLGCAAGSDAGAGQISRIAVCPSRCQDDPKGAGCDVCGSGQTLTTF